MAKGNKTGGRRKGVRNKATREISELAKALVPAALTELGKLAKGAVSESARVSAIGMILDRAYGKPSQALTVGNPDGTPMGPQVIQIVAAQPQGHDSSD